MIFGQELIQEEMDIMQNQTDPRLLRGLSPSQRGTGVFLVPNPDSEVYGDGTSVLVPNITYDQCIMRGAFVIAFKWVPDSVRTFQQMQEPVTCGEPCSDYCEEARCICNYLRKVCVPR